MRLIHTSDWHLGHTLHELPRRHEHAAFLGWLLDTIEREGADALLVAGDIFDTANPSAEAQADYYDFLARARARFPALNLVVIGGNHDSAARLDAADPLLRALHVRVVGGLPRGVGRALELERLLVPLTESDGRVAAWVAAVPFLRPADLPALELPDADLLVEGVRRIYAEVLDAAGARRLPSQAIVAMGHCYMTGTALSELSERRILGGNQHALPVDVFPEDVAYVALGHLHLAQRVGGRDDVRYSGSPIPLSFGEAHYRHQICVVDLEGERLGAVRSVPIPRAVDLLRLPAGGPGTLSELLAALEGIPKREEYQPFESLPYLEASVLLEKPEPGLRAMLETALEGRAARLARIVSHRTGTGETLAEAAGASSLRDLQPEEVFRLKYRRDHRSEPSPELLAAFHELVDAAAQAKEAA
jgi:exonuclease SbcD